MDTLTIENLSFFGTCHFDLLGKHSEKFDNLSLQFRFGEAYCLEGTIDSGAWGLSWVISGVVAESSGRIMIDNQILQKDARKKICCPVGVSKRKFFHDNTIIGQIRQGIERSGQKYFRTAEEVVDKLHLSSERLDRRLDQLSGERWRASIAIGLANNRQIYCFPWMKPEFISTFRDLWFAELIDYLKFNKTLVLIPTNNHHQLDKIVKKTIFF